MLLVQLFRRGAALSSRPGMMGMVPSAGFAKGGKKTGSSKGGAAQKNQKKAGTTTEKLSDIKEDPAFLAQSNAAGKWNFKKGSMTSTLPGVPGRYASALFSAAVDAKAVEQVEQEISAVSGKASENKGFASFLEDPTIPKLKKKATMAAITEGMSPVTTEFFAVLAENGRLRETPKIVESFAKILAGQRGEVQATVTSARPLASNDLTKLENAIVKLLKPGQKLQLSAKVDNRILGGLLVDVGSKHFDLSILGRVNKLRRTLEAPI